MGHDRHDDRALFDFCRLVYSRGVRICESCACHNCHSGIPFHGPLRVGEQEAQGV